MTSQPGPAVEAKTPMKDELPLKPTDEASTATDSSSEDALDEHVKDVLKKSKKEWLKRSLKGVWAFLKTPMGIITGIYGFMVVFWGAALVLFLLGESQRAGRSFWRRLYYSGWIPTSSDNTKDIWVGKADFMNAFEMMLITRQLPYPLRREMLADRKRLIYSHRCRLHSLAGDGYVPDLPDLATQTQERQIAEEAWSSAD